MTDITLEQRARELYIETLRSMLDQDYPEGAPDRLPQFPTERAALTAAIAALRLSAGADSARLDALEALVYQQPDYALLLHHGKHGINGRYAGLGLSNTGRTLRQAIDAAAPRHEPGEG